MSIRDAVYSRLSGFAGLTSLSATIHSKKVPQNPTYPIVFIEINGMTRVTALASDSGNVSAVLRTIAMSTTLASADLVANQVRAALQRWSGTETGVTIIDTSIDDEADEYDDDLDIAHIEQSFIIRFKE